MTLNPDKAERTGILATFVCLCFGAMILFIAVLPIINLVQNHLSPLSLLTWIFIALVLLGLIVLACTKIKIGHRPFLLLLFGAALLLKCAVALALDTRPDSDFALMFQSAQALARGSNELLASSYFYYWSYQSAFVAWMAMFIKLFGANLVFFKLLNCLLSALTSVLVYLLARRFASARSAAMAALSFTIYPGTFMLVSVLTNQHLSEFLFLLALYVYTAPTKTMIKKIITSGLAALLMVLSNAARPLGLMMLAALVVYALVKICLWLRRRDFNLKPLLVRAVIFISVYLVLGAGLSSLVKLSGLNPQGLANNLPEWKFIVGLNEETAGTYSQEDAQAIFEAENQEQVVSQLMKERLSISLSRFVKLAYEKSLYLWGSPEPTEWAITGSVYKQIGCQSGIDKLLFVVKPILAVSSGMYILINLLIALGIAGALRKKRLGELALLLMLVALAYFGSHLLIEVQSRYRSLMTTVTFPLMALGFDALRRRLPGKFRLSPYK